MKLTIRTADDIRMGTTLAQEHAAQDAARTYLDRTDWLVVRQTETGKAVSPDILEQRARARQILSAHESGAGTSAPPRRLQSAAEKGRAASPETGARPKQPAKNHPPLLAISSGGGCVWGQQIARRHRPNARRSGACPGNAKSTLRRCFLAITPYETALVLGKNRIGTCENGRPLGALDRRWHGEKARHGGGGCEAPDRIIKIFA